ncbi:hypothetical protein P280DRAFT_519512 [Massarina eburnea CBS 473.64]|uniref:Uncharacterized protein n=1 Tax=Massarina eburnea CBS 473.64 TaxID=1395130 RepID=A0A6A6RVZ6_9PLEO|nr:hypothetical protein P280DRAFT_519512 [Massarina eburnea CBS 473.64]
MRFSLLTLAGLAVLNGKLGVHARAIPSSVATSLYSSPDANLDATDNVKFAYEKRDAITAVPAPSSPIQDVTPIDPEFDRSKTVLIEEEESDKLSKRAQDKGSKPANPTNPAKTGKPQQTEKPSRTPAPSITPAPSRTLSPSGTPSLSGTSKPSVTSKLSGIPSPSRTSSPSVCKPKPSKGKGGDGKQVTKRALADLSDAEKVYQWLKSSNTSPEQIIFYYDTDGERMSREFMKKNRGYQTYHTIFANPKFYTDHGTTMLEAMRDRRPEGMQARSEALGRFAKNPYVFNMERAPNKSMLWKEISQMHYAGTIYSMKDNATRPDQVLKTLRSIDIAPEKPTVAPEESC